MITTFAAVQTAHGGPEVFEVREIEVGDPGPNEVRIRHTAIGVNFHDTYVRTGLYQTLELPGVPGLEAVGEITAIGPGVTEWSVGDRVAYIDGRYGAYAQDRLVSADLLVRPPVGVADEVVACSLVRGLTASMLLQQTRKVRAGELVLVHALGGTTGALVAAWAKHLGARVIGTSRSQDRAQQHRGTCERVYSYNDPNWAEQVLADYPGGVDYVLDSIGATTFDGSMQVVARCGQVTAYGQSSGPVAPVELPRLAAKSLTLSRPILFDYLTSPTVSQAMTDEFYGYIAETGNQLPTPTSRPLAEAGEAQRLLESGEATGPIVLIPSA